MKLSKYVHFAEPLLTEFDQKHFTHTQGIYTSNRADFIVNNMSPCCNVHYSGDDLVDLACKLAFMNSYETIMQLHHNRINLYSNMFSIYPKDKSCHIEILPRLSRIDPSPSRIHLIMNFEEE